MGTAASRVRCEIDFDRPGRQAGYLRAPQSRNTAGWGVVEIPIYVLRNGAGPTLLLTGGVHGDEYEGQIAVSRLAQTLRVEELSGRLILMPAVNIPAALNGTRLSPIDGRDLNRCFPGNAAGSFSEMLAHFIDGTILPHVDVSIDLHTAGHRRGVVCAPHAAAAEAGRAILGEGGNALEAMVAMAASIAAVYPHMNHLGGDGFWLVREPNRRVRAIMALSLIHISEPTRPY